MPKYFWILVALIFYLPLTAQAEFQPSQRRWSIGYENGVTMRRFLGKNWEVYLGGGPNDTLEDRHTSNFRDEEDFSGLYSQTDEDIKIEEGHIFLGTGRTLVRDQRFWLAGTFSVKYRWRNYQTSDFTEYFPQELSRNSQINGHRMSTTAYLGIRPAYEITSRITMMLSLGVYYRHQTETWDKWYRNDEGPVSKRRSSSDQNSTGLFGYYGIESISFMFRF